PEDEFHRIGVLEVDADRSPPPVQDVGGEGIEAPGARRPFEADDVRPHVGQHHAGERAGADPGYFYDAVSLERSHGRRGYLSTSCGSPLGTSTSDMSLRDRAEAAPVARLATVDGDGR